MGLQIDLTASFERKIEFFDIETECYCHTPKAIRKKFFSSRTNTSPDIFDMTTPSRNVVSTSSIRNPLLRSASMINSVSNKKSGMRVRPHHIPGCRGKPFQASLGIGITGIQEKPVQHPGARDINLRRAAI